MHDCNAVTTLMEHGLTLLANDGKTDSKIPYRQIIGKLLYITIAPQPDISFACWASTAVLAHKLLMLVARDSWRACGTRAPLPLPRSSIAMNGQSDCAKPNAITLPMNGHATRRSVSWP